MLSKPQSELDFENDFIQHAINIGGVKQWEYLPNIKTTDQLWANFRAILNQLNMGRLDKPLSDVEFAQVKRTISELRTPYEAGRWLYGVNGMAAVDIDRDDGTHVILSVFDQDAVGGGSTRYQIVNQIKRPAVIPGKESRRFDTTFLINGLPIIQVEEKKNSPMEALHQMEQYIHENQYSDIFSTVQILVAMSPTDIRYMANTTADMFNTDFAFRWQHEKDNSPVIDWRDFSNLFLNIPMAHYMSTSYMILDGTKNKNMLKVMRPYQVYATRAVLNTLREHDFNLGPQEAGYIWHTTGSGKTISSFKTAWLAQRLKNVDAVVFMVDRIALTNQTADNYKAYDPDTSSDNKGGVVYDTANISVLKRRLAKGNGITVTSIQKMDRLVSRDSFKAPDQNIVFIVDEAHRSTSGNMMRRIKKAFPQSAWIGYTGTPAFKDDKVSTEAIFGKPLAIYTIREAIADHNVLGFDVDFETTIPKKDLETKYLPKFYSEQYPEWTDRDIQHKIENMSDEDMDDLITPGIYDNNPRHVELVVKNILDHWRNRSNEYRYAAMLTTHVGGGLASTPMAMMYFDEFQRQMANLKHPLKVAVTFSADSSNGRNMINTNEGLERAIKAYNQVFNTHFDNTTVKEYTEDVVSRANRTAGDGNYLDLIIVVDQLLTGFDAPFLNTLYVDRTLSGKNLIQAYSRTNRIQNNTTKPAGHIVNFRWPAHAKHLMNEALAIYANRDSANSEEELVNSLEDDGILQKPFAELTADTREVVDEIKKLTNNVTGIPASEAAQNELYTQINKYSGLVSSLKQSKEYDYDEPDELLPEIGLTADEEQKITGVITNALREQIARRNHVDIIDVELQLVHVTEIKVNYDYLQELIAQLANQVHEDDHEGATKTLASIKQNTAQYEDRVQADAYERMADDLYNGHAEATNYPVKPSDVEQMIREHTDNGKAKDLKNFMNKWGLLDLRATDLSKLLSRHVAGADDLDTDDSLTDIIAVAQQGYQDYSDDIEVANLTRIKYRNQLRQAFTKFADHIVKTYGNY